MSFKMRTSKTVKKFDTFYSQRRVRFATLALAIMLVAPDTFAAGFCRSFFESRIERPVHEFSSFGALHGGRPAFSSRLRVLVWNVFKGQKSGFEGDFKTLGQNADLVLLQEAVDHTNFTRHVSDANSNLSWTLAKSYLRKRTGDHTGVATGSSAQPLRNQRLISPVMEPFVQTPKTALVSDFAIESASGKQKVLRVINVHAINFVGNQAFKNHMKQVFQRIVEHEGPVIFAGDFNTWNPGRTRFLREGAAALGLVESHSAGGTLLTLDYVFTRGLKTLSTDVPSQIRSSDHAPLLVEVELDS